MLNKYVRLGRPIVLGAGHVQSEIVSDPQKHDDSEKLNFIDF